MAKSVTEQALGRGIQPLKLVQDSMLPAMAKVAAFERTNTSCPNRSAARAMKGSLELIRPC